MSDTPSNDQIFVSQAIGTAVAHHQAGRLAEAENIYQQILQIDPRHADALHLSGVVAMQTGRNDLAIKQIANAIQVRPNFTEAYNNLGNALKNLGRLQDSVLSYQKATELNAQLPEAHYNLGAALQDLGDLPAALDAYQAALKRRPEYLLALNNMGNVLRDLGRFGEAVSAYQAAIELDPQFADAHNNYAQLLNQQGQFKEAASNCDKAIAANSGHADAWNNKGFALTELGKVKEAVSCLQEALRLRPDHAVTRNNLGNAYLATGQFTEAIISYQNALGLEPGSADYLCNLGVAHMECGATQAAMDCFREAIAINPAYANAYVQAASIHSRQGEPEAAISNLEKALALQPGNAGWRVRSALILPVIARSGFDHKSYRQRLVEKFAEIREQNLTISDPYREIGSTNFRLAYDEVNNRQLMQNIAHLYLETSPELAFEAEHCRQTPPMKKKRMRLGFVSSHLRAHTIGKLNSGIIEHFSRDLFEVILVRAPGSEDEVSTKIDGYADDVVRLSGHLQADHELLASYKFDILFYLDIGLHPYTYFLSFARLASIQAVTWGHPDTTGVPNVDYFLSSKLMEPPDAEDHYSEKLILLETMPTCYKNPSALKKAPQRSDFGLDDGNNLYLCPQTLFKFHPEYDVVLRNILEQDPSGRLVLIADPPPEPWRQLLSERLRKSLGEVFEQVSFLPFMSEEAYLGLLCVSDVVLDIPSFSGGNSTLEAFAMGTPVVTWPGAYMRGRVTAGYYHQMIMNDLIADCAADYIKKSIQICQDPTFRQSMRRKIAERRHLLFERREVVREIESFFVWAHEAHCSGHVIAPTMA